MVFKELFFHSSTLYFLFISGFLAMHLKEKITWKRFYLSKFRNVLLPYLVISIGLIFLYAFLGSERQVIDRAFIAYKLSAIVNGKVNFHLWYIPFIIPIFLLTPLLLKLPIRILTFFAVILFFFPLFGTRTATDITWGQYLYFFPVYILGMVANHYWPILELYFAKYMKYIIVFAVLITLLLGNLLNGHNFDFPYPWYIEGLFYVKRMCLTFLVLYGFREIKTNKYPLVGIVAEYSFALYFIHGPIKIFLQPYLFRFLEEMNQVWWLPVSLIYTILLIVFCMLLIRITKLIFGRNSRMLIGY